MKDAATPEQNPDARMWGMLCHLTPLLGLVVSGGFVSFLGPLVVWLAKREQHPFVDDQGKESLNFQITLLIMSIVGVVLTVVSFGLLFPLLFLPLLLQIVFAIIGSVAANKGEYYRYPYSIRIVK